MLLNTLTLLAYLLGNGSTHFSRSHLQVQFFKNQNVTRVANTQSPQLQWKGVPPEAHSLALTIKDKTHYDWVVYNLPIDLNGLPFGANTKMNSHNEGINSWGQKNYHALSTGYTADPVTIELYALDKRFGARHPMTGNILEQKIKGHVLAETIVHE